MGTKMRCMHWYKDEVLTLLRGWGGIGEKDDVHEESYIGEEDEVFEASVEVSLLLEADNALEVGVVDVGVHSEQPLEDGPHHALKVSWERLACSTHRRSRSNLHVMKSLHD